MSDRDQRQQADNGALAVQSGRDTIVQVGLNAEQMQAIISELARQIPALAAVAREVADARLHAFEERILEKFANSKKANSNAFKDPDFQYLLTRAQHAFARSGDDATRDTLVDLIAKRSLETQRSRLSLTLNEAVEKSAVLTKNEFAELSLCYLLRQTITGVGNIRQLAAHLRKYVSPLLPDISREEASYRYIVAQSCATISMGQIDAVSLIRRTYGGLFSKGFSADVDIPGVSPELSLRLKSSPL